MKLKRVLSVALAMAITVSGLCYSAGTSNEVKAADSAWTLEWSDEFDGTSLDTATWNYEIGNGNWGWGNGEKEYYTNRTENVEVSNGTLKIKALKENYGGQSYTSGRITTKGKQDFKYGKIEARIKLPSFSGAWPAFWMLGASGGWPRCGEIDIMEAINTQNYTHGALHWYVESENYNGQGDTGDPSQGRTPAGYQRTDWHTYGIIWDEDSIEWYIDDKVFRRDDISADHMSEFRKNQYIILNLAIGGQWPGYNIDDSAFPDRSVMEVDYVRVYKAVEEETTPYDGPMITVTQDAVAEYTGQWSTFFGEGWCGTYGSAETSDNFKDGYTVNLTSVGDGNDRDAIWSAQCNIENIQYYAGATYTYKCTVLSDVDKDIFVKVADDSEEALGGEIIHVKAGVPYEYETTLTIPEDYEGLISLKFGFGKANGENIDSNSAATIKVSDLSFVTTVEIPDPNYVPPTTTDSSVTTTTDSDNTKVTVKKAKIKKATKKKIAKKVKVTLKKIKGVDGYQVAVYKTKKNAKKNKKAIVKKFVKKTKVTIKSKKLKNKKKLFVKARAYVLDSKKNKTYGKWSKVKKVKINK